MKAIVDTNIILDVLFDRQPHSEASAEVLRLAESNHFTAMVTANSVTDVIYILRKHFKEKSRLYDAVFTIINIVDVCDVLKIDIMRAFELNFSDYEDALIAACAKRMKYDNIITRDLKDFAQSPVKAISPDEFLSLWR